MGEFRERRRRERENYPVLRFYARVVSGLSYLGLAVGLVFAALVILFAEVPLQKRITYPFFSLVLGGANFVILQGMAQAIYLLLDVARNSKASRELLEKTGGAAAPRPPGSASGDQS